MLAYVLLIILVVILFVVSMYTVNRLNDCRLELSNLRIKLAEKQMSFEHALSVAKDKSEKLEQLSLAGAELTTKLSKEVHRNKSVEVRTGQIMEKMAPFLEVFNHDPRNAQFLGNPIDYIIFNEDEIVFMEVKTGKARATKKQNNIKKLVEEGKVRFELIRFDYEGI